MEKHLLSKTTFLYAFQCPKRLYLNKYHRELKDPLPPDVEARFALGTDVGLLAQDLFPGGVDCSPEFYYDWRPSILKTRRLVEAGQQVIYEAAFQHKRVLSATDLLVRRDDGWHAIEVKSTNDTKEIHVLDAALQYWVMTGEGLDLGSISVMHLNRDYVRRGELDLNALFITDDVTAMAIDHQDYISEEIRKARETLALRRVPDQKIGPHCFEPYTCDFYGHCWQHIPPDSVFGLTNPRGKQWELYNQGVLRLADIPTDFPLSAYQQVQVEGERSGKGNIDGEAIADFLQSLEYPLYFLDFESIQPAVPLFDESRPYQQICFQYSLHIQRRPGYAPEHREFLADAADGDPRRSLLENLIPDLGGSGSIVVFNQEFEAGRLREMARDFPEFATAIEPLPGRMADLARPFRRRQYYTPAMKGSYSLKAVLPSLVPDLSYEGLAIADGGTASAVFMQMVYGKYEGDAAKARTDLLAYCHLDTLAMVRLLDVLQREANT